MPSTPEALLESRLEIIEVTVVSETLERQNKDDTTGQSDMGEKDTHEEVPQQSYQPLTKSNYLNPQQ